MTLLEGQARAVADSVTFKLISGLSSIIVVPMLVYLFLAQGALERMNATFNERFLRIEDALSLKTVLRYTSEDARRDLSNIDNQLADIRRRLERIEKP